MTRHELREQLQHDQFRDGVSSAFGYVRGHRSQVTHWLIAGAVVLLLVGAAIWFAAYRKSIRQQELQTALETLEASVAKPSEFSKNFPTQQAKDAATLKAFSDVATNYNDTREGLIAQYYVGTLKAEKLDAKGAEADLKNVADSSSAFAPLAKIALAQLYASRNRVNDARGLLQSLVDKPTPMISKAQAQLLLAQMELSSNPADAKKILTSLKGPGQGPAVQRAVDQLTGQLTR